MGRQTKRRARLRRMLEELAAVRDELEREIARGAGGPRGTADRENALADVQHAIRRALPEWTRQRGT